MGDLKSLGSQGLYLPAQIVFALWMYPIPLTPYFSKNQYPKYSDFVTDLKYLNI